MNNLSHEESFIYLLFDEFYDYYDKNGFTLIHSIQNSDIVRIAIIYFLFCFTIFNSILYIS